MYRKWVAPTILLLATVTVAPAQTVTLPATIDAKANRPIMVAPVVDGDDLVWEIDAGLDDWVSILPPEVSKAFGFTKIFYGEKGTFTVRAWTAKIVGGKAKISTPATCVIRIDGGGTSPPPIDPPTKPIDPPKPASPLYFLIVRSDGPASAEFSKIMADPTWAEINKAGHSFKDKTLTESAALRVVLPPGTALPVVLTLRVSEDRRTSTVIRGPVPLPSTPGGIRALMEGGVK